MYFDSSDELVLRMRDRLRDLLEADTSVRSVYPEPSTVRGLWVEDLSESDGVIIAITPIDDDFQGAAGRGQGHATYNQNSRYCLTVQVYADNKATTDQQSAQDSMMSITGVLRRALLTYRSDPTDGTAQWSQMIFDKRTTEYGRRPAKFWYSYTFFTLYAYETN